MDARRIPVQSQRTIAEATFEGNQREFMVVIRRRKKVIARPAQFAEIMVTVRRSNDPTSVVAMG